MEGIKQPLAGFFLDPGKALTPGKFCFPGEIILLNDGLAPLEKLRKHRKVSFLPLSHPLSHAGWLVGQTEHGSLFCILKVWDQFPIVFPSNKGALETKQTKYPPAGLLEQSAPAPFISCRPTPLKKQCQKGTVYPTAHELQGYFQLLFKHLLSCVKSIENYSSKVNGSKMARLIKDWESRGNIILHDKASLYSPACLNAVIFTIRKQNMNISYTVKNSLKIKSLDPSLALQAFILTISYMLESKISPWAFNSLDCSSTVMVNNRNFGAFSLFVFM